MFNPQIKPRRIGRFSIPRDTIEEYPDAVKELMRDLIVIRAEMMFNSDTIDYMAIGDMFPEVEVWEISPEYSISKRLVQFDDPNIPCKVKLWFEPKGTLGLIELIRPEIQLIKDCNTCRYTLLSKDPICNLCIGFDRWKPINIHD